MSNQHHQELWQAVIWQEFEPSAKNCIGALALYVSSGSLDKLQPMSANFGIIEGLETRVRAKKTERYKMVAERSLEELKLRLK